MNFHDIWTVAKKELKACFSDKVILAQILILPFVIVFGYSLLMSAMSQSQGTAQEDIKAYTINCPSYLLEAFENIQIKNIHSSDAEAIKDEIKEQKAELLILFPEDFKPSIGQTVLSDVQIYYNSENTKSLSKYNEANTLLYSIQPKAFTINASQNIDYDLGDENGLFRRMLGTILPMMLFMAVYTVVMNLAAESVAGDKERGFLNTMLITPVKRSSIAGGKSLCVLIAAILGGISAFLGMALSLPNLAKAMQMENSISYQLQDYIILFLVTITAIFVIASILLIISTVAKDVKQATNLSPVFMLIIMVAGMLTMNDNFNDLVKELGTVNFIIPAWNTMIIMKDIIQLDYSYTNILISCGTNIIFAGLIIFLVGKLFENENMINN